MGARFRRVEVVANIASGKVTEDAPEEARRIFADFGVEAHICAPPVEELDACLRQAVDAAPDLLVVIAGDGTARRAAELCGPEGPLLAPLPGGTMNVLPHAIYGPRSWQDALSLALTEGEPRLWSGGEVEGRRFLVSAMMGSPALFAPAREAVRRGLRRQAVVRARRALQRVFHGRLRYTLDDGPREKAEALVFMCPAISRALDDETPALEAAALDVRGAGDVLQLGFHALVGDWRSAPSVEATPCQVARVWSSNGVPSLLDGEPVRLGPLAEVRFAPAVARMLAISDQARGGPAKGGVA